MSAQTVAMHDHPHVVRGAVLVGGASRRFGSDKADAMFGDTTLLVHQLRTLQAADIGDLAYVGGSPRAHITQAEYIADEYPGEGPLGGMLSILHVCEPQVHAVVVLAVDVPLVAAGTIRRLIEVLSGADAAVAMGVREHWSCVAIRRTANECLQESFNEGNRAVHLAMQRLRLVRVRVDDRELTNVNDVASLNGIT